MKPLTFLQNRRLNKAAEVLLWGSLLLYLLVVFYSVDKGLNFEDEGFYLLRYQQIQPLVYSFPAEHLLVRALYPLLQPDAVTLRVLNNILAMISATLLFFGVKYYTQRKTTVVFGASWHYAVVLGGGMAMLSSGLSLSYNSLTVFFTEWAVAALLVALAIPRWRWLWFGLAGAAVGLLLYTKITSFFAVGGLLALFVLVQPEQWSRRFSALAAMGLGLITLLLLLNWWIEPGIVEYYRVVFARFKAVPGSHNEIALLKRLWDGYIDIILQGCWAFGIMCLIFKRCLIKFQLARFIVFVTLIISIFITDIYPICTSVLNARIYWFIFFSYFFYSLLNEKSIIKNNELQQKMKYLITVFFLLIPLAVSFGHDFDLVMHTKISTVFYFIAIIYWISVNNSSYSKLFIAILFIVFFHNLLYKPFRKSPLYTMKYKFNGIYMEKDKYEFFSKIDSVLNCNNDFVKRNMVDLYQMAGVTYLLDGRSPGGILWNYNSLDDYIKRLKIDIIENNYYPLFFVYDTVSIRTLQKFDEIGIHIQKDYDTILRLRKPRICNCSTLKEESVFLLQFRDNIADNKNLETEHTE